MNGSSRKDEMDGSSIVSGSVSSSRSSSISRSSSSSRSRSSYSVTDPNESTSRESSCSSCSSSSSSSSTSCTSRSNSITTGNKRQEMDETTSHVDKRKCNKAVGADDIGESIVGNPGDSRGSNEIGMVHRDSYTNETILRDVGSDKNSNNDKNKDKDSIDIQGEIEEIEEIEEEEEEEENDEEDDDDDEEENDEEEDEEDDDEGIGLDDENVKDILINGINELDQHGDVDVFRNVGQGLTGHYKEMMMQYWQELINEIEMTNEPGSAFQDDFKSHSIPFARIRKVMKTDEEVKMISSEAPIIFAKACEIFITELTMRAWCIAEKSKRRTLQKNDIAEALKKSDIFDFLIDIVPRAKNGGTNNHNHNNSSSSGNTNAAGGRNDTDGVVSEQ